MKLRFLGTRGFVEESSRRHRHHSALLIEAGGFRLLCDFGQTHLGRLGEAAPDAILLSHAHPDHAGGLEEGTEVPVYASPRTAMLLRSYPVRRWRLLAPGRPARVGPWTLTAHPVLHSLRCPAIALRLEVGGARLVYSGDLVAFRNERRALDGCTLYVGDGSTLTRPLVRRHAGGALIGHTTVRAQLSWLGKHGVPEAVFSHLGSEPIALGDRETLRRIRAMAARRAPDCRVHLASDGSELRLGR